MNWTSFAEAAPELAVVGAELFDRTGLSLLGTLRKDGSPRISPCESYFVDGELMLGMMWRSMKALDLLRDARLVVHSTQCDREGTTGDFKLYGRAVEVTDPRLRVGYGDATEAKIDWRPSEPFNLFAMDIQSAGFIRFGDQRKVMRWSAEHGFERLKHPED
jgi:hypothetical protein